MLKALYTAALVVLCFPIQQALAQQNIPRYQFKSSNTYLRLEFLNDDLVHFEAAPGTDTISNTVPIYSSPMVATQNQNGPTSIDLEGNRIETPHLKVFVDPTTLCASVYDKVRAFQVADFCVNGLGQPQKAITVNSPFVQHAYGLGEKFVEPLTADGDWIGRVRDPGSKFGNAMVGFKGGGVADAQFPVLYGLGEMNQNFALFLDNIYAQRWDFTASPWKVSTSGDVIRWYVMTGPDLPHLRTQYMELVGHPPVPPKRLFGFWMSQYGYEDWNDLKSKLVALRADHFPVDGFYLDLQWFGGIVSNSPISPMGKLRFDESHFPNPAETIRSLKEQDGVGVIPIEESYVSEGLDEYRQLATQGFLAHQCGTPTAPTPSASYWWGRGGMIDWTHPAAGDFWHDSKRQTLIDLGVVGHWIDLGEPEMFIEKSCYYGTPEIATATQPMTSHADIHNLFALKWAESIARGYRRHGVQTRPYIMSRSGTSGIQRFGAGMWSGDIGGNLGSLAAHEHARTHMSFSGVDYFASDIGGFHRNEENGGSLSPEHFYENFTQWLATGLMFDIPARTHTDNQARDKITAPDRAGQFFSNLANIRLRYTLIPYYYSLAHRAYLYAEPVIAPLPYYYQNDLNVRTMGHEKLIGRDLLAGMIAKNGETVRDLYLPAGHWVDYRTHEWYDSKGGWIKSYPEYRDAKLELALMERQGAIIPEMFVDDQTMNSFGKRLDATTRDELMVRVASGPDASQFTLYEDDGETIGYQSGEVRTTVLSQISDGTTATVVIGASNGTYRGAPSARNNVVELQVRSSKATAVEVNDQPLRRCDTRSEFDVAGSCWFNVSQNLVLAKLSSTSVATEKKFVFHLAAAATKASVNFVCDNGMTDFGKSAVFVAGSAPELGSWDPARAVRLDPTNYPTWTGVVGGLVPGSLVEWKCLVRGESSPLVNAWESGPNHVVAVVSDGFGGSAVGGF